MNKFDTNTIDPLVKMCQVRATLCMTFERAPHRRTAGPGGLPIADTAVSGAR